MDKKIPALLSGDFFVLFRTIYFYSKGILLKTDYTYNEKKLDQSKLFKMMI
jgi:hypothetical protein